MILKLPILIFGSLILSISANSRGLDLNFPSANNRVSRNAILVYEGVLYLGGDFTQIGGKTRHQIAAVDLSTGKILDWDPDLGSGKKAAVSALAEIDGVIYVGGSFETAQGKNLPRLIAVSKATRGPAEVLNWRPAPDAAVLCLLAGSDGKLYAGGRFEKMAGQPRLHLAGLEPAQQSEEVRLTAFAPKMDAWVASLIADPLRPSYVIAGGIFRQVNGAAHEIIARLNRQNSTVEDAGFVFEGGPNRQVMKLISAHGRVWAAGVEFNSVNGQPRENLFCFESVSGKVMPFKADLDAGAGALAMVGNKLYVGGDFRHVNGIARRMAVLNAFSGKVLPWNPETNGNTYALFAHGRRLIMSGYWKNLMDQAKIDFLASLKIEHSPPRELMLSFYK